MRSLPLPLPLPLTCLALVLPIVTLVAPACSDDGVTTSCAEMTVTEYDDNGDPVNSDEVEEWWDQASAKDVGCATAPGGAGPE